METQVQTPNQSPVALTRLVDKIKTDCGSNATVEVTPNGTSHGGSQRKYSILLVSKKQNLSGILNTRDLEIVGINSKRSGAYVKTIIDIKVPTVNNLPA